MCLVSTTVDRSWYQCAKCHSDDGRKCRTVSVWRSLHQLAWTCWKRFGVSLIVFLWWRQTFQRNEAETVRCPRVSPMMDSWLQNEDLKLRGPGDLFGIRQSGVLEF